MIVELVILVSGAALVAFALVAIARHDWVRMTRPSISVRATVIGYQSRWDEGRKSYAARFQFDADGQTLVVTDQLLRMTREPALGHEVQLRYPKGRPDLARKARPVMWVIVYAVLLTLAALLAAELAARLN